MRSETNGSTPPDGNQQMTGAVLLFSEVRFAYAH
jgi:hypothetical protein